MMLIGAHPCWDFRQLKSGKTPTHRGHIVTSAHACREAPGRLGAWHTTWAHHPCRAHGWGLRVPGSP